MFSPQDDIFLITTSIEAVSGLARGLKHWPEGDVKLAIEAIILPLCESLINSKNIESLSLTETLFQMICGDRDYRRQMWLIDFLKTCFGKSSFSTLIDVIGTSFVEFRSSFAKIFDEIIIEFIIPNLNLGEFAPNEIQSLTSLFFARNIIGTSSLVDNSTFIDILFNKLFDKEIQNSPEKLVEFFNGLISSSPISPTILEPLIPRISKLLQIQPHITQKHEIAYRSLFVYLAILPWNLVNGSFLQLIESIQNTIGSLSQPAQVLAIQFLNILSEFNLHYLSAPEKNQIKNKIAIPLFSSNYPEVQSAGVNFLISIVHLIYTDFNSLGDFVKEILEMIQDQTNQNTGILCACTVIRSISIGKNCPTWLPGLFEKLSSLYESFHCHQFQISEAAKLFWSKHQYHVIPEIEDYRFSFLRSYLS